MLSNKQVVNRTTHQNLNTFLENVRLKIPVELNIQDAGTVEIRVLGMT
jgi:hypothetical protein